MATKELSFSKGFSGFTQKRMREIAGIAVWLAAGFVAMSLASYTPNDPSLNYVSHSPIANWGGYIGAIISDFLTQTVGLASWLIVAALISWGWRLMSKTITVKLWLRISALMLLIPVTATILTFINAPLSWPIDTGLGGAMGVILRKELLSILDNWLVIAILSTTILLLFPIVMGLTRSEWGNILKSIILLAIFIRSLLARILPTGVSFSEYDIPRRNSWFHSIKIAVVSLFTNKQYIATPNAVADKNHKKRATTKTQPALKKQPHKPKIQTKDNEAEQTIQQTLKLRRVTGEFQLPNIELLKPAKKNKKNLLTNSALEQNAHLLESVLHDFGIKGEITAISPGPVVTLYELEPSPGTKSSRVIGLADDIARSMSAVSARISVISGRNAIGIELPNSKRETVFLRELLEDASFTDSNCKLPMALGKDIGGNPVVVDLARMPHLLVAGTTGSGKSVSINTMIASLLYTLTPDECKFIMIDPKMLELSVYDGIPHLLSPVVTEPTKAVVALKWTVKEMENRYRLMANLGVRNVDGYNKRIKQAREKGEQLKRTVQTGFDPESGKPIYEDQPLDMNPLPFIVVVVDEMADLMLVAGKDIESSIQRLAQMARAAGIHIIMATQRPSVDVITGVIKANFPTRISFQVTSRIDSRTILGEQGAEQLLGMGDMLYMAGGGRITRVHGPFVSDGEIEKLVTYLKSQGEPEYLEDITTEPEETDNLFNDDISDEEQLLYQKAIAIVKRDNKASTSYIQRCLKIGYNRAARLIEQMEREGIVSKATATGKREILIN